MRALVLDGRPRLVKNHPEPSPVEGEVVVRVRQAGICDTDLQLVRGYMGYQGVLGHEFVGVAQDGDLAGRRVVADINAGCGVCADCRERDGHHCTARTVLGIVGRDGAFADRLRVPARCLVPVPDEVTDEQAVFAEPLAAGLHVLEVLPEDLETPVVVLGDGKLGLLTTFALRSAGVPVHHVGHHRHKLALAEAVGAQVSLESDLDPDLQAQVVVEATGHPSGLARALSTATARGTIVLKTTVAGPIEVDLSPVVIHELRMVGSRCGNMARAVGALASGQVDPRPLIHDRYSLDEGEAAIGRAAERGVLKVLLEM